MARPVAKFMTQGVGVRILSALIMAPVALGLAYLGGWAFGILVIVAAGVMAYEWNGLCHRGAAAGGFAIGGAVILSVGAAAAGYPANAVVAALVLAIAVGAGSRMANLSGGWALLGVVYVAVPCIAMIWLRAEPERGEHE